MKDTMKRASNPPAHGRKPAPLRRSSDSKPVRETPVCLAQDLVENAPTKIEAHYQEIDRLIGEVLLLVDLLFINHNVTVSPGDSVHYLLSANDRTIMIRNQGRGERLQHSILCSDAPTLVLSQID